MFVFGASTFFAKMLVGLSLLGLLPKRLIFSLGDEPRTESNRFLVSPIC
jgi:hypothetical protein